MTVKTGLSPVNARASKASASSVLTPAAGIFSASARPRATETPTRTPVKEPGPTETAIAPRSANAISAASSASLDDVHQDLGMALADVADARASSLPAVGVEDAGGAQVGGGVDGEEVHVRANRRGGCARLRHPPLSCRTSPPQGGRSAGRNALAWSRIALATPQIGRGDDDGQSPPLRGRCPAGQRGAT